MDVLIEMWRRQVVFLCLLAFWIRNVSLVKMDIFKMYLITIDILCQLEIDLVGGRGLEAGEIHLLCYGFWMGWILAFSWLNIHMYSRHVVLETAVK